MTTEYKPRGGVVMKLLARMATEPQRIFTSAECAQIMGCKLREVGAHLLYAIRARRVYKRRANKVCEYSASPMEGAVVLPPAKRRVRNPEVPAQLKHGWATSSDDPRIGKVDPTWKPPVMRHVRGGQ